MTELEVLKAARELISDESRWVKRHYATSADGLPVDPNDPAACRWCAVGAVLKVLDLDIVYGRSQAAIPIVHRLSDNVHGFGRHFSVQDVNDASDHATILALFDKVIAEAEAQS